MTRYTQRMGKLGGIILLATLTLTGSAAHAAPEVEQVAQVQRVTASAASEMLSELRPLLTTLNASDSELVQEAYVACGNLAFRDKSAYRDAILAKYPEDLTLGLDHLTVAAAGKQYLCP